MFRLKHAIHGNYPPFLGTQISISLQQKNSCSNSWPVRICSWQPPSDSRPSFLFLFKIYIYLYIVTTFCQIKCQVAIVSSLFLQTMDHMDYPINIWEITTTHYGMAECPVFIASSFPLCCGACLRHLCIFPGTGYMLPFSPVFIFFVGRTLWTSPQDACTSWRYSSPLMKEHSSLLWIWVEPHVALLRIRLFSSISITITDPLTANG